MTASQVTDAAHPIIVGLLLVLAVVMVVRVVQHLRAHTKVPVVLRRDVALFVLLALVFTSPDWSRILSVNLIGEVWWAVATNVLAIVVLAYWVAVEVGVIQVNGGLKR